MGPYSSGDGGVGEVSMPKSSSFVRTAMYGQQAIYTGGGVCFTIPHIV